MAKTLLATITETLALGGSSTFLLNLARGFARRERSLPIVVMSEGMDLAPEFRETTARIHGPPRKELIYEDRLAWAYDCLQSDSPRAVLACLGPVSFEGLRLVPPGVARLGILQSDDPGPYQLVRHFSPWVDGWIGVSREICRKIEALIGVNRARVEFIPYGIDFLPPQPRAPADPGQPLNIVYVGRLVELQKRISRIISLIRLAEREQWNVRFTLVGGGPDADLVQSSLADCQIVRILGAVPNREIPAILRSQEVFVLLSDFEGLPLSLLEAMGEGLVPVISDLPSGVGEVVTAETGFRVPVGDLDAAAVAIRRLERDRRLYVRLSENARRVARADHSADQMAGRFIALAEALSRLDPPKWPASVRVPVPRTVRVPFLYQGLGRRFRRAMRRFRNHRQP